MDKAHAGKLRLVISVLLPLGIAAFVSAFLFGSSGVSLADLLDVLTGAATASTHFIFFNLRLPRAILAFVSGGALAISGACLQGMFKNPMADSYVIGVSAGAALGATIALAFSSTLAFWALAR